MRIPLHLTLSLNEVKDWQKRSTTLGDWNKKQIYDIVFRNFIEGISFTKIKALTKLSKPTISRCLNDLERENKIQKTKQGYFVKSLFDDDGQSLYGLIFETLAPSPMLLIKPQNERELNPDWKAEEFISEFSKRIGRYITYIFIEALRKQKHLKPLHIRSQLASDFVYQSIPLDSLLACFRDIVPREKEDSGARWELGDKSYAKLSSAFHNTYPETWEFIEVSSSEFIDGIVESFSPDELRNGCDHIWYKVYIAKKGQYHACKRCPALVKILTTNN